MSAKPQQKPKLYIVKKYVMAASAVEAIMLEKDTPVHDAYIDARWADDENGHLVRAIGFEKGEEDD